MIMFNNHGSSGAGAKCKRVNSLSKKILLTTVGVRQAQEHINKIHTRDVAIIADIKNNPEALLRYCLLAYST